jgi:AAA family ATP:ADP antiporter
VTPDPFVKRAFGLREGDVERGLPLFAYHFLVIAFYMIGRVARDAIFLDHFTALDLPYADVSAAACAGGVLALYLRAGRRADVHRLQIGSLLFIAGSLVILWWGVHVEHWAWCAATLYVWVGICGVLAVTQVWTLANFVWTTREAKRLFGLLGSAGIVGGIAGGFIAKWIAKTTGTDAMLLVMAALLLPCAALVPIVWAQRYPQAGEHEATGANAPSAGLRDSVRLVGRSPYLRTIAILIALASVATTVVGWQFKAIAKDAFVQKDALAAYLGAFTGYAGLVSLLTQLLVTTKLLRRFGVGVALLVLPCTLALGSVAVAFSGALWAATLVRGSDNVFRYSVDSSAVQLLYLPVPAAIKLQVKSFIDTVVWKVGDGFAGLILLVFATAWRFTPQQISWVTLVLIGGWIAAALVARQRYVATLRENIQQVSLRPDPSVPMLDHFTSSVIAEKLGSSNVTDVLYALWLFEIGRRVQSHDGVHKLLAHPSPVVRFRAIGILSGAGDLSVRDEVAALLNDDNLAVRTEALQYMARHDLIDPLADLSTPGNFARYAIRSATVAFLARPGADQNIEAARMLLDRMARENGGEDGGVRTRLEAARLIASLPGEFDEQIALLIRDPDPAVAYEAVLTVGQRRVRSAVPALVEQLANSALADEATQALSQFGDAVIGTLRERLNDPKAPARVRQAIPQVLLRIGSPAAAVALAEDLLQVDLVLRFRIISALNKLHETRRNLTLDRQALETGLTAELMGHYRSYQLLGGLGGVPDAALKHSMDHELERIFRLLKLLFPSIDLQNAYTGVQSSDPRTRANALEFLDNTLDVRMRSLLVPLIDSEVTVAERVRLADRYLGFTAAGSSHQGS